MATDYLREKINILNNMIQQAALEQFQLNLLIKVASVTAGDAQVDQQLQASATNAKAQLLACERRLAVYREELAPLNIELGG